MVKVEFGESNQNGLNSCNLGLYVTFNNTLRTYFYTTNISDTLTVINHLFEFIGNTYTLPEHYTEELFKKVVGLYDAVLFCFDFQLERDSGNRTLTLAHRLSTSNTHSKNNVASDCGKGLYDWSMPVDLFEMFTLVNLLHAHLSVRLSEYQKLSVLSFSNSSVSNSTNSPVSNSTNSSSTDLSSWQPYFSPEDYEHLTSFVDSVRQGYDTQTMLVLFGKGGNGKTTLLKQIIELVGKDNCVQYPLGQYRFDQQTTSDTTSPFLASRTSYPHLYYCEDCENINSGLVKSLLGRDSIIVDQLYGPVIELRPEPGHGASVIYVTNSLTELTNLMKTDFGFSRRVKVLTMTHVFNNKQVAAV